MTEAILTLNAGSSTLKYALYAAGATLERRRGGTEELSPDANVADILPALVDRVMAEAPLMRLVAAAHRVVHGGERYTAPVAVDAALPHALDALVPLAPLHMPGEIAVIRAMTERFPDLPQVACFDTAFHATQPPLARRYALPRDLTQSGIRRYGFHGLSYAYIASVLPDFAGARGDGRVIVAHLGNGASLCAMHGRKSVATTMGFTALDGLMMGTRCGALDPGIILFLLQEKRMKAQEIETLLYSQSGLKGVSGISHDVRELLASDAPEAEEAIALFCRRAVQEIAALAAVLEGLDVLVFTAGIGENNAVIRRRIGEGCRWLGLVLDPDANANAGPCISTPASEVAAYVIPTDEEVMLARDAWRVVR